MKKIYSILSVVCLALFAVSCSNDTIDEALTQEKGYLKLDVSTLVSTNTNTRAATQVPSDYNSKTIALKITNSEGETVLESEDATNDDKLKGNLVLTPGTYTITGSSAGWDGSNSGFGVPYYAGTTKATVTAKTLTKATLTLTQANVKVTVKYDDNFRTYFKSAKCVVSSAISEVNAQVFSLNTVGSAYFPVADLNFFLGVVNMKDESYSMSNDITDVKARDHYIINYKLASSGSMGGITVKTDDATQSYTYEIQIPRKSSIALDTKTANAWSTFADLSCGVTAKTTSFDESGLSLQWKRQDAEEWTSVPVSSLTKGSDDTYTYRLSGLTPGTAYSYRLHYEDADNSVNSNETAFSAETQESIENSGFENWTKSGNVWSPNAQGSNYWSSSNQGSAGLMGDKYNVTTGITDGAYKGTSAQLQSMYVVIKFAAASLFTGDFDGLIGTSGAKLKWGVPFTSRPSALKGYMKYSPGSINRGDKPNVSGARNKGETDECQIYCALLTERLKVANASNSDGYEMSTSFDWQNDPRVVAFGELTQYTSDSGWKEFEIPLKYHSLVTKPKYMLIVCSSSHWGDYFYGSDSSKLLLDEFSFEYGEPTVK